MNYLSIGTRAIFVALIIGLLPLAVSAHSTSSPEERRAAAQVPMKASELASFVLSAAALVTAGIALSRTRKHH